MLSVVAVGVESTLEFDRILPLLLLLVLMLQQELEQLIVRVIVRRLERRWLLLLLLIRLLVLQEQSVLVGVWNERRKVVEQRQSEFVERLVVDALAGDCGSSEHLLQAAAAVQLGQRPLVVDTEQPRE